jgi:hypothetical protein
MPKDIIIIYWGGEDQEKKMSGGMPLDSGWG